MDRELNGKYAKMYEINLWVSPLGLPATLPEKYHDFGGFILGDHKSGFKLDRPRVNDLLFTIQNAGGTGIRVLPYCQWYVGSIQEMFEPYVLVKHHGWHFDLTKFSDNYWDIIAEICSLCDRYNLDFAYGPFDSCGLYKSIYRRFNPWWNNLQGVRHFVHNEELAMSAMDKTFSVLGGFKNFFFYWCNEFQYPDKEEGTDFARKIALKLKGYGIPAERTTVGAQLLVPYTPESYTRMLWLKEEIKKYEKDSQEYNEINAEIKTIYRISLHDMIKGYAFEPAYGEKEGAYGVFRPYHGFGCKNGQYKYSITADIAKRSPQLSIEASQDACYLEGGTDKGIDGRARPNEAATEEMYTDFLESRNFAMPGRTILELCPKNFADEFKIVESHTLAASKAIKNVTGKNTVNFGRDKKLIVI